MATKNDKTASSVLLDTTSAQYALDKLTKKVDDYDQKLKQTNLTQREIASLQKSRAEAAQKAAAIQLQVEKGLGATLVQQKKYVADLAKELSNLAVGTEAYARTKSRLDAANVTLAEMKSRLSGVEEAQLKVSKSSGVLSSFFGNVLANVAVRAAGAVKDFFVDSFNEALQAEEKTARLKNTLENLGETTVFDRMIAKGNELAERFKYLDNDDVTGVFERLIDYGKLTEKQMNELLPVIIDFAAKNRISLDESATQLIKFIESGKGLKGYSLDVKDAKTETERLALVTEVLGAKVQGAGEAFQDTAAGGIATAKQQLANLKEEIGNGLVPVMSTLLGWINKLLTGFGYLKDKLGTFFSDAGDLLTGDFGVLIGEGENQVKRLEELNKRVEKQAAAGIAKTALEGKSAGEAIDELNQRLLFQQTLLEKARKNTSGVFNTDDVKKYEKQIRVTRLALDELFKTQSGGDNSVIGISNTEDSTKGDKKSDEERKRQLEQLAAFQKKVQDLQYESDAAKQSNNEKEILLARKKYADLILEAEKFKKLSIEKYNELRNQLLKLSDTEVGRIVQKQFEEGSKKEYEAAKASLQQYIEEKKIQVKEDYANQVISKEEYDARIISLEQELKDNQVLLAKDYVAIVKDAEKDLTEYTKQAAESRTNYDIAQLERKIAAEREAANLIKDINEQALLKQAQLGVARTAPGSENRNAAEIKLLQAQRDLYLRDIKARAKEEQRIILANTVLTEQQKTELIKKSQENLGNEVEAIEADFREQKMEKELQFYTELFSKLLTLAQGVADILGPNVEAEKNKEDQQLAQRQKRNEKEKAADQRLLNNKLISRQEFNKRSKALDDQYNAQAAAAKKKQFERQQQADIIAAVISGAQSVLSALQTKPFLLGLALATVAAIKTKRQIDVIKSQPVPEFGIGGHLTGPSHRRGGMPVINPETGRKEAEVEGGEVILSRSTVHNNQEIVGALLHSSMKKKGAAILPFWKNRPFMAIDYEGLNRSVKRVRHFENGGVLGSPVSANEQDNAAAQVSVTGLEQMQVTLEALTEQLKQPVKSYVVYSDFEVAGNKLDQIKKDAIFK